MRNLLSFLLGILSDLLYVFVCFALFLDRAVTFVWDAPLRRRTGGVIHALARSRAASAALIFIPCFLLPFSLLTQKGVLILAGDRPLGFVQDADMLSGTVQEINMTYTRLATFDNKLISIPNSAVVAAQIVNYSAADTRRVDIPVSASYDAPTQKVIDALVLAGTMDNVLLTPAPSACVSSYGDSAIAYTLRVWVKTEDYWDVYFALTQRVKDVFDEQGIAMTYPHLNVHLDK